MDSSESQAAADAPLPGALGAPRAFEAGREPASTAALEMLFRRYEPQLGVFLAQVVRDRSLAEDLLQETFLTAVRERGRVASIENPEAWLFAIARNRALNALRTRRRAWNALQRLARERRKSDPDPADAVAVRDYLGRHLKPEERVLLVLRYVHGYRSPELAQIVGRSPEAIRQELSRARRKLIARLDAEPGRPTSKTRHEGW